MSSAFNIPAGLSAFDEAVAAELPCVSTLEYNSHKICKWFAKNIRERLAAAPPVDAVVGEPVACPTREGKWCPRCGSGAGFPLCDDDVSDLLATPAVSRAEGLMPSKLRRDQIVDLISSVSNNSADHDIAFAYRVLDAASAVAPAAPAEPSAGEAQS